MTAFLTGAALLLAGYHLYGRLVERAVCPDPQRRTPAVEHADGVDYVVISTWRVYLIQLLNIAGLGPVFGAILGALWGPQVLLWIVLGAILGGAVHDFLSGAMSMREGGAGFPELVGRHLGKWPRHLGTAFVLILVVLVGTVFVKGPALLLLQLIPAELADGVLGGTGVLTAPWQGQALWLWIVMAGIFAYYVAATLLPIDKLIGRFYPILAVALLVMVVGLTLALLRGQIHAPDFALQNLHPKAAPAWPVIFITVSCGAISGFHATQSPLMARCLGSERHMRLVFLGAMIAEGFIALVWATVAHGHYGSTGALAAVLAAGGPGQVVHEVCVSTMGILGGALAVLGVVVLPITSGDTAFRVARLILAEYLRIPQVRPLDRYKIALPLFAVSIVLCLVDFAVVWRYFGWANQTLAAVALWTGAAYLRRRPTPLQWLATAPAVFMTVVTTAYILSEPFAFGLPVTIATVCAFGLGAVTLTAFLWMVRARTTSSLGPPGPRPATDIERHLNDLAT
ncbi:MAG: carbon starvation protein A [Polyangiaceae bacterium]|nr:carbon starvation protein A [Polyangiaceae bacterium]